MSGCDDRRESLGTNRGKTYVTRDGAAWAVDGREENRQDERQMTPIAERFHDLGKALQEAHIALTDLADVVAPVARPVDPSPDPAGGALVRVSMSMVHGQALDAVESVQDLTRRIRELVERIDL